MKRLAGYVISSVLHDLLLRPEGQSDNGFRNYCKLFKQINIPNVGSLCNYDKKLKIHHVRHQTASGDEK